ncbi:Integrase catalytic core protein [Phytophthora cinnamomi]|uniref:Integrase catalytic core protein n=1 Tax=Phytophthora cinnamomi TaxID=4785 RepID=UPI00355A6942|nr:Integrase catalytic core protein [Phytophthora cinnamomi]
MGYHVYVPGNTQRIRESAGVIALDRMLQEEVVLPADDIELPLAEGGGEDEEDLHEVDVEAGLETPAAPTQTVHRNPQQKEAVRNVVRSTHWTRDAVEELNGTNEFTERRASERFSARAIRLRTEKCRSERLRSKRVDVAYLCFTEVIREPLNLAEARPKHDAFRNGPSEKKVQLRLKIAADGTIDKSKARICTRGDCQIDILDYLETPEPVMDRVCVKLSFAFVAKFGMAMRQGDVPAAYLKAPLKETVFVKQVKGFEHPGMESNVWRLKKALDGLKQAGREWNLEIDKFLKECGL